MVWGCRVGGLQVGERALLVQHRRWIPLLAASVNPEDTPLFRNELTEETHKAEEQVKGSSGAREWRRRRERHEV